MTKSRAVLLLLLLAGILWILATRQWGVDSNPADTGPQGVVSGAAPEAGEGSPLLTANAAVLAVAAILLAMLRKVGRIVVCVLVAAVGVGTILSAVSASAVPLIVWLTVLVGAAIVGTAVWTGVVSLLWTVSARYDRQADSGTGTEPEDDPAAAWDALTRGEDPS